jgi:acylphosphatase
MQAHIIIHGFVQGVGFRQFVKSTARKIGLTGWVKNTSDGRVEILVQGPKEGIEDLVVACKKGPFLSEVKSVQIEWEKETEKFKSFEINH